MPTRSAKGWARKRARRSLWAVAGLPLLLACGGSLTRPELPALTPLVDINPDPRIVEVELVAGLASTEYLPGKAAPIWAYRDGARPGAVGTVPGPLLQAQQGDQIIVHVRNELPVATTIHWHGLRLPAPQDGSMAAQAPIPPGASHEYRFPALDPGSYWYHPHVNADEQIERGLYAPLIIHGGAALQVAADRYLVLDDVKLRGDGQLDENIDPLDVMLGRPGNVFLVNGVRLPRLQVAAGSQERWRLVNVANGRYFNLSLPGHRFYVIGWDGGLLPVPYVRDSLLIAPGERYEVLVTFESPGREPLSLKNLYYDRGHNIPDPGPKDLLEIVYGPPGPAPAPLPTVLRQPSSLRLNDATPVRRLVLSEKEDPAGGPASFQINGQRWPAITPLSAQRGAIEIWEIEANPEMDHPFHLHGMFFQVLSIGGLPPAVPWGWKDTVNVPRGSTLRFAVQLDPPGTWMFHCHILEHAERGMMGELEIH
jgi:FtsP/CotA-like multicopper oxidase with cupredoxin domain